MPSRAEERPFNNATIGKREAAHRSLDSYIAKRSFLSAATKIHTRTGH